MNENGMMTAISMTVVRSATVALILCLSPLFITYAKDQPQPQSNQETHLANIRQLTFGGKNAEAYFSFDGEKLVFQSTKDPKEPSLLPCYQIFTMDLDAPTFAEPVPVWVQPPADIISLASGGSCFRRPMSQVLFVPHPSQKPSSIGGLSTITISIPFM